VKKFLTIIPLAFLATPVAQAAMRCDKLSPEGLNMLFSQYGRSIRVVEPIFVTREGGHRVCVAHLEDTAGDQSGVLWHFDIEVKDGIGMLHSLGFQSLNQVHHHRT
jgi:hypothetical protein